MPYSLKTPQIQFQRNNSSIKFAALNIIHRIIHFPVCDATDRGPEVGVLGREIVLRVVEAQHDVDRVLSGGVRHPQRRHRRPQTRHLELDSDVVPEAESTVLLTLCSPRLEF